MEKNKKESLIGIDIGKKYFVVAQIKIDQQKILLENYIKIDIPIFTPQDNSNEDAIKNIKQYLPKFILKNKKIFLTISDPEIVSRMVSLPKMADKDFNEALKWEIKNHVSFDIEEAIIDRSILGESQSAGVQKLEIITAAAPKKLLNKYSLFLKNIGINIDGVTIRLFSIYNLAKKINAFKKDEVIAVIDISHEIIRIIFLKGDKIQFFRDLATEEENLSKSLNDEQLSPAARRFINEINRSFDYFREQHLQTNISQVLLMGGLAGITNLNVFLSNNLGFKVENFNLLPFIDIGYNIAGKEKLSDDLPYLVPAIGAAISKAKEINFLKKMPRIISLNIPYIDKLISALSASILVYIATALISLTILAGTIFLNNSIRKDIDYLKKSIAENKLLLSDIKLLSEKKSVFKKISSERIPLKSIIIEFMRVIPQNSETGNLSFLNSEKSILWMGRAKSMDLVGDTLYKIESSKMFSQASLIEAKKNESDQIIDFKISFKADI